MKKVVNGSQKGYLFEKEEFEAKLKERFPILKSSSLRCFDVYVSHLCAKVALDESSSKGVDEGILLLESVRKKKEWFIFDIKVLQDILGIKEKINSVEFKCWIGGEKYNYVSEGDTFFSDEEFYYYLETEGDFYHDTLVEVK